MLAGVLRYIWCNNGTGSNQMKAHEEEEDTAEEDL